MTVKRFVQPDYSDVSQTGTTYPLNIDAAIATLARNGRWFAPHQLYTGSPSPDWAIELDAGWTFDGTTLTEIASQVVTGFTAPSVGNYRTDRVSVNSKTGAATRTAGVAAGSAGAAAAPALPAGHFPICTVLIASTDTVILNSMITDARAYLGLTPVTAAFAEQAMVAANTMDIASTLSDRISISPGSPSESIVAFSAAAEGVRRKLRFTAAVPWTHNATSMILIGGASMNTAAGDQAEVESLGSGNWRVRWYMKADGTPITGSAGISTIASGSLPAAATLDIANIPATYTALVLQLTGVSSNTATRAPLVRASVDNGSSFDSTATNYPGVTITPSAGTPVATKSLASLVEPIAAAAAETFSVTVVIQAYHAGPHKKFSARAKSSAGAEIFAEGFYVGSTSAINALRILWDASGNFDAGTYVLYGIS